jgi:xylulose-5-phosphate/fructose-6-phosphate phosphoketolase
MLSEHSLQGLIQGYVLTGRHGVFASYEAFIQVVASMADQYAKFIKVAREVSWRKTIPSLNYILTSGAWRQEHNGFSHQNPGFIDDMLQRQGCFTNVYFPADANIALATFDRMMQSTREINVLVCSKRPIPVWRTTEEAATDVRDGLAIWDFASDENPDLVYVGVGDYPTQEVLAAMSIVRQEMPKLKMRFVNIVALSALGMGSSSCRILPQSFEEYFTENKPIIVNFHGYPQTMKQILFDYGCESSRVSVRGYVEAGSTTTVFDMMVRNKVDRFHLAMEAFDLAVKAGVATKKQVVALKAKYEAQLVTHRAYVIEHGDDPADITNWSWQSR